ALPILDCNGTLRRGGLDGARLPAQLGRARAGGTIPRERTAPPIRVWPLGDAAASWGLFERRAFGGGVCLWTARQAFLESAHLRWRSPLQSVAFGTARGHRPGARARNRCRP